MELNNSYGSQVREELKTYTA